MHGGLHEGVLQPADRAALAGAEIARIQGRELEAEKLYERAIRVARERGFVHNEALAYERAATFYASRGFDTFARAYLRNARACYLRWGAAGKVAQLDTEDGGEANAVNEHNDVVGARGQYPQVPVFWPGFQGTMIDLPLPEGAGSGTATEINDEGVIVGYY